MKNLQRGAETRTSRSSAKRESRIALRRNTHIRRESEGEPLSRERAAILESMSKDRSARRARERERERQSQTLAAHRRHRRTASERRRTKAAGAARGPRLLFPAISRCRAARSFSYASRPPPALAPALPRRPREAPVHRAVPGRPRPGRRRQTRTRAAREREKNNSRHLSAAASARNCCS